MVSHLLHLWLIFITFMVSITFMVVITFMGDTLLTETQVNEAIFYSVHSENGLPTIRIIDYTVELRLSGLDGTGVNSPDNQKI